MYMYIYIYIHKSLLEERPGQAARMFVVAERYFHLRVFSNCQSNCFQIMKRQLDRRIAETGGVHVRRDGETLITIHLFYV